MSGANPFSFLALILIITWIINGRAAATEWELGKGGGWKEVRGPPRTDDS